MKHVRGFEQNLPTRKRSANDDANILIICNQLTQTCIDFKSIIIMYRNIKVMRRMVQVKTKIDGSIVNKELLEQWCPRVTSLIRHS